MTGVQTCALPIYNIAYRPDPLKTDGLFHLVDLRVKNRKDLVVHVRKGYYALKM